MKLNAKTLSVLKNFCAINQSIKFDAGNTISTADSFKTAYGKAKLDQEIDQEFTVYDLSRFLNVVSAFKDADITVKNFDILITAGSQKFTYRACDPSLITLPPKNVKTPAAICQFTLTKEMLAALQKAVSVLSVKNVAFVGKDGKLLIEAYDGSNEVPDCYSVEVGQTDKEFKAVFLFERFTFLPNTYDVSISKTSCLFRHPEIEYVIVAEKNSTFN